MQVSKSKGDLRSEKLSLLLLETFDLHEMPKKLADFDKVHQEVDPKLVLKHVLHVYEERVVNSVENILLKLDVVHLFILNDDVLADTLHSVKLTWLCAELH